MSGLANVKVGDRLVLIDHHNRERMVAVEKVGRAYVYADGRAFYRDSGREKVNYGHGEHLLTVEMAEQRRRRDAALAWLRSRGITIEWSSPHRARAVDIANALRPVLEPETGEG